MKKLYTFLCLAVLFLFSATVSAQVLIPENFEGGAFPAGWTQASSPAIQIVGTTPCEGAYSARMPISSGNAQARLRSPIQTTTGDDIKISFSYKIINQTGGGATPTTFGSFDLQYTTDANATTPTWTTYAVIDATNHTPSTNCATNTATIPAASVPAGSDFAWRIRTNWAAGSYYVFIDEFLAVEQVSCIEPIYITVTDVTFDQAKVSWTDLNGATNWVIEYGPENFSPGFGFGTVVNTNTIPTVITGLDDGEPYDVFIKAVCSGTNESSYAKGETFQTIAIGTDCNTPKQITTLPYNHSGNTQTYGNSYTGSPGTGCIGNNYLQGYDIVYKYTPAADDYLNVKVSNLIGDDSVGIFIYESCANIGTACYAGDTTSTGSDIVFDVFVVGGQTYYFVLATAGANTSTEFTLDIKGFDCPSFGAPDGLATYQYYNQSLGAFDNTRIGVQPTNDFADLVWYEDNAGVPGAVIPNPSAVPLTNGAVYHVNQVLGTCQSAFLTVTFTEFDCLGQLAILTTDTGNEICDEGTTILSATAATNNIFWYDTQFGGEIRGTGPTFTTDVINQTTSYWVSEAFIGEGNLSGQANPGPSTVSTSTSNNYGVIIDNINSDFVLVDVQVFSTAGGGATTITLSDISGTEPDQTKTVSIPAGSTAAPKAHTISLNFELTSGKSYRLLKTSGPAMIYSTSSNASFPYTVGTVAEVTSGSTSSGTSNNYYYFYNWTITEEQPLCESPRTEVIATVNEVYDVVPTATSATVCVGQNADLTVTSTDTDYVYTWTWTDPSGAPQTLTGASIQPTIVQNTTFTVTGYNPITDCTSPPQSINIEAIGAGEINVIPQITSTCVGEIVELFAGGVFNNFEAPTNDWTTVNNSTGPDKPAEAGWKLVDSPYGPLGGMTSNDNSQFYVSIADKIGPTGNLDTELISPSMNLVGVQNATLTFYHHYDVSLNQSSQARVQVSVANGSWTTLKTYSNTAVGTPTQFAKETISLNAYSGAADVRIRFKYTGDWAWWWAIDNVDIIKDYTNGQIIWTSQNDLFLDDAATVPYTGTPTNQVYFKSDVPGVFNYNVELNIIGCSAPVTSPIEITVHETPAPTGPANQIYVPGQNLTSLDVTGQGLRYYVLVNGEYVPVSPNSLLVHGTTYYITQTLNACESEYLEVTVSLDCPAPTDLMANTDVGSTGTSAAVIVTWTPPASTKAIKNYYLEITDSSGNVVFQGTADATVNYRVIQGLAFEEVFVLEMYSVCDPTIPVYSSVGTVSFDTIGLGTESLAFDGFTYYPNPTSNVVTFSNVMPIKNIEVYTVSGQQVLNIKNIDKTKVIVDFERLPSGVYFSLVTVGDSVQVVRIIRE